MVALPEYILPPALSTEGHCRGSASFDEPPEDSELKAQREREEALVAAADQLLASGSPDFDAIYQALRAAAIAHLDGAAGRRLSSTFLPPDPIRPPSCPTSSGCTKAATNLDPRPSARPDPPESSSFPA